MALDRYKQKRDFKKTPEPAGAAPQTAAPAAGGAFVVQKHDASHLHYDFRLEMEGVLKSWAIPKGPSLDPSQKRLAVRTEDHPMEYRTFEGTIPEGEYGGGTVMVWDEGRADYEFSQKDLAARVDGRKAFSFALKGKKLSGGFRLVPIGRPGDRGDNWLLIKSGDEHARGEGDILVAAPDSATTGRTLEQIAAENPSTPPPCEGQKGGKYE